MRLPEAKPARHGVFEERGRGDPRRANMAHVRQSRPESGLSFQAKGFFSRLNLFLLLSDAAVLGARRVRVMVRLAGNLTTYFDEYAI